MRVIGRRPLLAGGGFAIAATLLPGRRVGATATETDRARDAMARVLGGDVASIRTGRVSLSAPLIADDGATVPIRITVDSPMTETDHVTAIHLFAVRNPLPHVGSFHLFPDLGKADLQTRVRLAESQRLIALARMTDGSVWSGAAEVRVTAGGCRT